jgi:hypothetical protein
MFADAVEEFQQQMDQSPKPITALYIRRRLRKLKEKP